VSLERHRQQKIDDFEEDVLWGSAGVRAAGVIENKWTVAVAVKATQQWMVL
jgi:hypothetical protein